MASWNLRQSLSTVIAVLAVIAIAVCGSLAGLAMLLERAGATLSSSAEGVRLAEEAEVDLLALDRARDPVAVARRTGDIRWRVRTAARQATSPREAEIARLAGEEAERYFAARADSTRDERSRLLESADRALAELVDINVAQSAEVGEQIRSWHRAAYVLAGSAGALFLTITSFLIWWLSRRAFLPVFALAAAVERFGQGDLAQRAAEIGPAELRDMSHRFNEMASAITRQRKAQLAALAGVAHDLRTPIHALKLSSELLRPGPGLSRDQEADLLERIRRQVGRLERMVEDLLETSRIEVGGVALRLEERDVRDVAAEVAHALDGSPGGHRIEVECPADPVLLRCDPVRVEQVLTNIVTNAIKYSPEGGRVRISVRREPSEVVLAVSDDGIGMSEDEAREIFEPFRRSGRLENEVPGFGLGLFVVRRIVEAHHGSVAVRSEPGRGSTFEVHLPLSAEAPGAIR